MMRKHKQYILYIIVILLSLVSIININNTSALNYSSSVGVGFTFNPTLSVSLSSSDLVISNLVPGNTLDSNVINVSVASNASYGYTLSAMMNGNNSDLVHTNNSTNNGNGNSNNIFSSIATNADLSSLEDSEDTNIWGYSYKDNTIVSPSWSNYNGLSSSVSKTLLDANTNNTETGIDSIDFKIAAKASNTQASGTYTGVINFTAVSNVAPMSLLDSFIASGAEQLNGYFKMQDITHDICANVDIEESELQLIDVRDNKVYWVAKLKDGNCWMTQNLDLDLSHEVALTSETSDIDPESYGTTIYTSETGYSKDETTGVVSWLPNNTNENNQADTTTIIWNNENGSVPDWEHNYSEPYSADPGDKYQYTNNSNFTETFYDSFANCVNNNDVKNCQHTHLGNYYNWSAAVASNNTANASENLRNSICPKGWKLPTEETHSTTRNFENLLIRSGIIDESIENKYTESGFNKVRIYPLYFVRSGAVYNKSLNSRGTSGFYWSNTSIASQYSILLRLNTNDIIPTDMNYKLNGFSIRCLAK